MSPRAKTAPTPKSRESRDAPLPSRPAAAPQPITPQPGFQRTFLASKADVVIGGGVAGAGKSWALLMEPTRNVAHRGFEAVIFRRTYPELTNPGGLWDESKKIYARYSAIPKLGELEWIFPDAQGRAGQGGRVTFAHVQHDQDAESNWKGAQVPYMGFDQLETFTETQFWYLWSRNRSTLGLPSYIQATCNPVPDDDPVGGWLRRLIDWWIGPDGYAIPERAGILRWFLRINEALEWGDSREVLVARFPPEPGLPPRQPKSLTFIPGRLEDNPALLSKDPGYVATLDALPYVERMRLRHGNWNARPASGNVFNRAWFELVDGVPREARRGRGWDKAGSQGKGDYSAGVKLAEWKGIWYVEDVARGQWSSGDRNDVMVQAAEFDGRACRIVVEVEPGSGGKESGEISAKRLVGYDVRLVRVTGSKLTRANPLAAQAQAGNVKVLRGPHAEPFIAECHRFTGAEGGVDDQCIPAGTLIDTWRGQVPVEQVAVGERVWTRSGYRCVTASGLTSVSARLWRLETVDGQTLLATKRHPVYVVGVGYKAIEAVSNGAMILACERKRSRSTVEYSSDTRMRRSVRAAFISNADRDFFIAKYGQRLTDPSLGGTSFIIRMIASRLITLWRIWSASPTLSTSKFMRSAEIFQDLRRSNIWRKFALWPPHGTDLQLVVPGIASMGSRPWQNVSPYESAALSAERSFGVKTESVEQGSAQLGVLVARPIESIVMSATQNASTAVPPSWGRVIQNAGFVPVVVRSVSATPRVEPVYNLGVEGVHEYVANGMLVHNCDAASLVFNDMTLRGAELQIW